MSKRVLVILVILTFIVIAGLVGYRAWNKPFNDPLNGDAIKVSAAQLFSDFSANESASQKKYVPEKTGNKKVEVTGEIKEIGKNDDGEAFYILKTSDEIFGVKCIMDKGFEITNAKNGDEIAVRGFCDGYNMDVIVNRCKPVK